MGLLAIPFVFIGAIERNMKTGKGDGEETAGNQESSDEEELQVSADELTNTEDDGAIASCSAEENLKLHSESSKHVSLHGLHDFSEKVSIASFLYSRYSLVVI